MSRLDTLVRQADYWRGSPFTAGGPAGNKEWLHFCVRGSGVELLVNFSVVDDMRHIAAPGNEFARLTVLSRDEGGAWDGDVELYPPSDVEVESGGMAMTFGRSSVAYRDGLYRLSLNMRTREISAELTLRPLVQPAVSNNIRMDAGTPINWALIPRLEVDGWIELKGHRSQIQGGLGYHDHNWGLFEWGRDFAWEWAYALPSLAASRWTVVFVRLNNRAHTRTYMQGLFLWQGSQPVRVFRGSEMAVRHDGLLPPRRWLKIPRAMALVEPGTAADVPATVHVHARGRGDEVEMRFDAEDLAQVIIPNDTDVDGVTIINEVTGHLVLHGNVGGTSVHLDGHGMFEFIRG